MDLSGDTLWPLAQQILRALERLGSEAALVEALAEAIAKCPETSAVRAERAERNQLEASVDRLQAKLERTSTTLRTHINTIHMLRAENERLAQRNLRQTALHFGRRYKLVGALVERAIQIPKVAQIVRRGRQGRHARAENTDAFFSSSKSVTKIGELLEVLRSVIGAPYNFWGGGELEDGSPAYMGSGYSKEHVMKYGINCSGLFNWGRDQVGLTPIGGTPAYAYFIRNVCEPYNPDTQYPVGTILVNDDVDERTGDHSHIAMISKPDQTIIQADSSSMTVNECLKASVSHQNVDYYWAGPMPDLGTVEYTGLHAHHWVSHMFSAFHRS